MLNFSLSLVTALSIGIFSVTAFALEKPTAPSSSRSGSSPTGSPSTPYATPIPSAAPTPASSPISLANIARELLEATLGDLHQGSLNSPTSDPDIANGTVGSDPGKSADLIGSCFPHELENGYAYDVVSSGTVPNMIIVDRRGLELPFGLSYESREDAEWILANKLIVIFPSSVNPMCEIGVTFANLSDANGFVDLARQGSKEQVNADIQRGDTCKQYPSGVIHCLAHLGKIQVK